MYVYVAKVRSGPLIVMWLYVHMHAHAYIHISSLDECKICQNQERKG